MSLARKTVKGVKYLYFVYYDPGARKKVEQYCGPADDPKSLEVAKRYQAEYLANKNELLASLVDSNESKLQQLNRQGQNNSSSSSEQVTQEYAHRLSKMIPIYDPEIYFKSSEKMQEVKDNSVQLIVTSPPYNVGKEYHTYNDSRDFEEYLGMLEKVWLECKRILCAGGRIAINVADTGRQPYLPLHVHITKQLLRLGFLMRGVIYWDKGPSVGVSTAWGSWRSPSNPTLRDVGEHILIFCKDSFKLESDHNISTISPLEFAAYSKSIWNMPTVNAEKEGHPAPFPEELPRRLIKFYTFLGDTVLDPFLGSGTTCRVARSLGRRSIGYEMDERYRPIIERKIGQVTDLGIDFKHLTINGRPVTEENFPQARLT
jgi:DNA modification methylase